MKDAIAGAREQVARRGHHAGAEAVTRLVLLFDDAEFIPSGMYRTLSQLLQACNSESLQLHLVLVGGPGLWKGLNAPDLAELRKAAISETLIPYLEEAEAADYLDRKLQYAGQPLARLMTKRATADLVARAHGLPARLDALAEQALAFSYARGRRRITARRLRQALADAPAPGWAPGWALGRAGEMALAALAVICLGGVGGLVAWQHRIAPASDVASVHSPVPVPVPVPVARVAALAARPEVKTVPPQAAAVPKAAVPVTAQGGHSGLVLLAEPGDNLASLYAKVYRGVVPPAFVTVQAANRAPVTPGMLVMFPAPPGGWPAS